MSQKSFAFDVKLHLSQYSTTMVLTAGPLVSIELLLSSGTFNKEIREELFDELIVRNSGAVSADEALLLNFVGAESAVPTADWNSLCEEMSRPENALPTEAEPPIPLRELTGGRRRPRGGRRGWVGL